ncbi:MAG: hypothetical protein PHH16_01800 [Candidatus Gracilibacteria bacterium]|nr:hypothetical protein [Candidatus Gracilibacteria bacterium]
MNTRSVIVIMSIMTLSLTGCSYFFGPPEPSESPSTQVRLTEPEARSIAEKICIKGGESLTPGYYNENSKTWWFDANLNATQPGCNPACVVSEDTKTAEINWRCTGLVLPKESANEVLRQLFAEKYPKYAGALTVRIDQETPEHARGGVIFETGAPGGLFLATKIDGEWQIVFDGNGQIPCNLSKYGFPTDMLSDCTQTESVQTGTSEITNTGVINLPVPIVNNTSYQDVIDYVSAHITEIITAYSSKKATNGKWFADGFGFTSANHVYVDFEDGHYLFRALLECKDKNTSLVCTTLAIFEKQKQGWVVSEGKDTQKDNPIVHTWAKDYKWER